MTCPADRATMERDFTKEFIHHSVNRMEENTTKILKCFAALDEKDVWIFPNESSNSIGNLALHLCGNIRQYILSGMGNLEDIRERDKEFSVKGGFAKAELLLRLNETTATAISIIKKSAPESLLEFRTVQGFTLSGLGIIYHVIEHFSYHTGQIIFFTKLIKNKDLGFYVGIDLNKRNRSAAE